MATKLKVPAATPHQMTLAPKDKPRTRTLWFVLFNHEKDAHVLPNVLTFDSEAEARRAQHNRRGARLTSRTIAVATAAAAIVSSGLGMCGNAHAQAATTTTTASECAGMFGAASSGFMGTTFQWKSGYSDGTKVCSSKVTTGAMVGMPIWQIVHLYLFTGGLPFNEGTVSMIDVSGLYAPNVRPTCIAQPAWTMPEFALGREIPDWPMQAAAVQASYAINPATIAVRFWSPDALMPNANYSINVICGVKQ